MGRGLRPGRGRCDPPSVAGIPGGPASVPAERWRGSTLGLGVPPLIRPPGCARPRGGRHGSAQVVVLQGTGRQAHPAHGKHTCPRGRERQLQGPPSDSAARRVSSGEGSSSGSRGSREALDLSVRRPYACPVRIRVGAGAAGPRARNRPAAGRTACLRRTWPRPGPASSPPAAGELGPQGRAVPGDRSVAAAGAAAARAGVDRRRREAGGRLGGRGSLGGGGSVRRGRSGVGRARVRG